MTAPDYLLGSAQDLVHEIELLLRSRYGLIGIQTREHERAEVILRHLADRLSVAMFHWSPSKGWVRPGAAVGLPDTEALPKALDRVLRQPNALYLMRLPRSDGDTSVPEPLLREIAGTMGARPGGLILTAETIDLSEDIVRLSAIVDLPLPTTQDYRALLQHTLRDLSQKLELSYDLSGKELETLLGSLRGLTLLEAEKVLTKAIVEDKRLSPSDLEAVIHAKRKIVERDGVLEYFPVEHTLDAVAGLGGLKNWLRARRNSFHDPKAASDFGLTPPRGILLLGVPGCGKSLCAKAVAAEWQLPLLKLDPSRLYQKYIGETEKNLMRATKTAESIAPVVLWIDEIEKALGAGGGQEDGGTSQRVFGSFLTWLQEHRAPIFVVATSNDVHSLPPELLRKGRFDEIFFVDLPDEPTRHAIFQVHLERRQRRAENFDLAALAKQSTGFSGAEIEQAIVAALFAAFATSTRLSQGVLEAELRLTRPLSTTMSEKLDALRAWCEGRVRAAG